MHDEALEARLESLLGESAVPVVCAWLFGSEARGEAAEGSDLDLAVLLPEAGPPALRSPLTTLRGELERGLDREVDLIDLHRAPPDLVHRVLRDGRLVLDRDPDRRVAFEVGARNAWFDVLPHLERYRRASAA